jgi:hypothetical protein
VEEASGVTLARGVSLCLRFVAKGYAHGGADTLHEPTSTLPGEKKRERLPIRAQYELFGRNGKMAGRNYWAPRCNARTRAGGRCKARVVVGSTGPRSRCRMHGGADGSGQQTKEGRRRIGAAVKAHQLAFWEAWRQAGSQCSHGAKSYVRPSQGQSQ